MAPYIISMFFSIASSKGQNQTICIWSNFQGSTNFVWPQEPEILWYISNIRQRWPLSVCSCLHYLPLSQSDATGEGYRVCFWLVTTAEAMDSLTCLIWLFLPWKQGKTGNRTYQTGCVIYYLWNFWLATWGMWRYLPEEEQKEIL